MIEQIKTFETNAVALEVIGGFSETDEKFAQKLIQEKLDAGFDIVNILVKVDEYKIMNTEAKAIFEDLSFLFKKIKNIGNIAIVTHSKVLKVLVSIDNVIYKSIKNCKSEKYFDVEQLDEALEFISKD